MHDLPLKGLRVLVVEDEYLLASELCSDLEEIGAAGIGPIGHLDDAIARAHDAGSIDAAILDIDVGGQDVYPLADLLTEKGVPLVFATGHSAANLPPKYAAAQVCSKPVIMPDLCEALRAVVPGLEG